MGKQEKNKDLKNDVSEDPPRIFRASFVQPLALIMVGIFIVAGLYISLNPMLPFKLGDSQARHLLYVNAEILATMLTVTLGITLLGMQFRAQSYSLVGMMEYMKDRVIYGFTILFACATIFSIIAANAPADMLTWLVIYAIVVTSLSFFYHAAYIYYLVYKLQISQMLKDNYKKMEESAKGLDTMTSSEHSRPFEIWEGIMKRTIETGNYNMFRKGLKYMYEITNNSNFVPEYKTYEEHYSKYLMSIKRSCLEKKQYSLIVNYTEQALDAYSKLSDRERELSKSDEPLIWEWTDHIIRDLEVILYNTIDEDEHETYEECLKNISIKIWKSVQTVDDNDRVMILCQFIRRVIMYGLSKNSIVVTKFINHQINEFDSHELKDDMNFFIRYNFSHMWNPGNIQDTTSKSKNYRWMIDPISFWYSGLVNILEQIFPKIAKNDDKFTYVESLKLLLKLSVAYEKSHNIFKEKEARRKSSKSSVSDAVMISTPSYEEMLKISALHRRVSKSGEESMSSNKQIFPVSLIPAMPILNNNGEFIKPDNECEAYDYSRVYNLFHRLIRSLKSDHKYSILEHFLISLNDESCKFKNRKTDLLLGEEFTSEQRNNDVRTMLWDNFDVITDVSMTEFDPTMLEYTLKAKTSVLKPIKNSIPEFIRILGIDISHMRDRLVNVKNMDNRSHNLLITWCLHMLRFLEQDMPDFLNQRDIEVHSYVYDIIDKENDTDFVKLVIDQSKPLADLTKAKQKSIIKELSQKEYNSDYRKLAFKHTSYFEFYNHSVAILMFESGNYKFAMHYINRALINAINKKERSKLYKLAGDIMLKQKQSEDAKSWYGRAFDIDPENLGAKIALDKFKKR